MNLIADLLSGKLDLRGIEQTFQRLASKAEEAAERLDRMEKQLARIEESISGFSCKADEHYECCRYHTDTA